jgi:hypothetical protein
MFYNSACSALIFPYTFHHGILSYIMQLYILMLMTNTIKITAQFTLLVEPMLHVTTLMMAVHG